MRFAMPVAHKPGPRFERGGGIGVDLPGRAIAFGKPGQFTRMLHRQRAQCLFLKAMGNRERQQPGTDRRRGRPERSEEHTSELQSLMRISYAVSCLKKKKR